MQISRTHFSFGLNLTWEDRQEINVWIDEHSEEYNNLPFVIQNLLINLIE